MSTVELMFALMMSVVSATSDVPADLDTDELYCLTEAVYFEAGNQWHPGKLAVAHNIVNRKNSGIFPDTICGVTHQKYQYSYNNDGKPETVPLNNPIEKTAWIYSSMAAISVMSGRSVDPTKGALYYYNPKKANPKWAKKMVELAMIGDHRFMNAR